MSLANLPQFILEFAPASTPSATAPTWVDISSSVRHEDGVTIRRGRQSESTTFNPGTMQLTLNNRVTASSPVGRLFDPRNSAGTYFGNLKPRKQIRARALWNAVYYPLFQGFVEGWPQEYRGAKEDMVVPITAYDALAVLAETAQPDVNLLAIEAAGTETLLLNQFDGTAWTSPNGSGSASKITGVAASSPLAPGLIGTGVTGQIQATGSGIFEQIGGAFIRAASSDWSFSFWFRASGQFQAGLYLVDTVTAQMISFDVLNSLAPNAFFAQVYSGYIASGGVLSTSTLVENTISEVGGYNDGLPHHAVFVYPNATKLPKIYVDGALVRTDTVAWPAVYPDQIHAAAYSATAGTISTQLPTLWSTALTGTQATQLYQLGAGYLEESTGARFTRLLDSISWPSALRDLTANPKGTCGDYTPYGRKTLSELQTVEATEHGRVFVSKDGLVTLHDRYHYLEIARGKTVQATFSDDGSDIKYQAVGTDFSDREVANDITVTASKSLTANTQDATSISDYGLQSRSVATILSTQTAATDTAAGLLLHAKDAVTRTRGPIDVRGVIQTSQWPTILGLEIGDRIQHEITPRTGAQAQLQLLTEGQTWKIKRDDWLLSIDAVPVPGGTVAAATFCVADDATYGKADTARAGF